MYNLLLLIFSRTSTAARTKDSVSLSRKLLWVTDSLFFSVPIVFCTCCRLLPSLLHDVHLKKNCTQDLSLYCNFFARLIWKRSWLNQYKMKSNQSQWTMLFLKLWNQLHFFKLQEFNQTPTIDLKVALPQRYKCIKSLPCMLWSYFLYRFVLHQDIDQICASSRYIPSCDLGINT